MRTKLAAFSPKNTLEQVRPMVGDNHGPRGLHLYPVVDEQQRLCGIITRNDLRKWMDDSHPADEMLGDAVQEPMVAYPDEPLRVVVYRMAETGLTRFPVVERGDERKLVGATGLQDLLSARTRNLSEERDRERVLRIRLPWLGKPAAQ